MSAQTVQESIEETPERITTFRLHKTTGEILGNFSRTEAIEQTVEHDFRNSLTRADMGFEEFDSIKSELMKNIQIFLNRSILYPAPILIKPHIKQPVH